MKNFKKRILPVLFSILMLLSVVVAPVNASNDILSDIDIIELRLNTSVPRKIFASSKDWVNKNMGEFNLDELYTNNQYIGEFRVFAFGLFGLLFLWQIYRVITGQSTVQQLLIDFIRVLIWLPLMITFMYMGVLIANAMIRSLIVENDFTSFVNKNIYNFILDAEEAKNQQNILQGIWNNITSLISKGNPVANVAGSISSQGQYKTAVNFIAWSYVVVAYLNWFTMFMIDFLLKLLFMFSPVIAIMNILGQNNSFTKKFWSMYWDCLVGKVAFFLIFRLIVDEINKQANLTQVNIGFAMYCLCLFIALSALVYGIRELFKLENIYSLFKNDRSPQQVITKAGGTTYSVANQTMGSLRTMKAIINQPKN